MDQVRSLGPIQPVVVRPLPHRKFEILANAETWVAAGRAGIAEVPVSILEDLDDESANKIVRANCAAASGNAIDEAYCFEEQLAAFGGRKTRGSTGKLAVTICRSRPFIAHSLRLLDLPQDIQDLIRCGKLSAGQARPLIAIGDRRVQRRLADEIIKNKMTARNCELLVKGHRTANPKTSSRNGPGSPSKDPNTRRFEQQVSEVIGCKFELKGGRAVIDFGGNLEVLEGVVERLGYRGN